jgi:hypothetical protein
MGFMGMKIDVESSSQQFSAFSEGLFILETKSESSSSSQPRIAR